MNYKLMLCCLCVLVGVGVNAQAQTNDFPVVTFNFKNNPAQVEKPVSPLGTLAEKELVNIPFAKGGWRVEDFIPVKSWRFDYVGSFEQRSDALVNKCPAGSPKDIFDNYNSDVYAALVYGRLAKWGSTVSSRMAWDYRMAPLIVLVAPDQLVYNKIGYPEFREHWEVVLYDRGINIWHHYFKDGKQAWYNAGSLTLPDNIEFSKDKPHLLSVQTSSPKRGPKRMTVSCEGYILTYTSDDLPDTFFAGLIACEGRNFFYDFTIKMP